MACAAVALGGCATQVPAPLEIGGHAASLRASVEAIARGPTNLGRLWAVRRRARELGLAEQTRSEWIDWLSLQRNVLVEVPGTDPGAGIVYLTAHYDKTDINPLKVVSLLTAGLIDEITGLTYLGQGAVDNATGVAIVLELAADAARSPHPFTLRALLPGAEESGLRGTRAHLSRLSAGDRELVRFALNVDSVATAWSAECVSTNVSDGRLVTAALRAAERMEVRLGRGTIPDGASSDFEPFTGHSFAKDFGRGIAFGMLVGGLLPQRSWFTRGYFAVPVANFSACGLLDFGDWVGASVLLPTGRIHGPRDRASRVDLSRLEGHYRVLRELLRTAPRL